MNFKTFHRPGNWARKVWIYFWFKIRGHYIANTPFDVPFYKQRKKNGDEYRLKSGTQCYVSLFDLVLELKVDRWFALGNSELAKSMNSGISQEFVPSEITDAQCLLDMKRYINQESQRFEDKIIEDEINRAGGITKSIIPHSKDFNN